MNAALTGIAVAIRATCFSAQSPYSYFWWGNRRICTVYTIPRCLNVMEISLPPLLRHRNPDFEPLIPNSRVFEAFEGFFKFERIFNHPHPLIQYPSSFWGSSCCFGVINLLPTCAPVFFRMSVVCFCAHK